MKDLKFEEDLGLDIFQYTVASLVLASYVKKCQEVDRKYSFRYFAKQLECSDPGYVQRLIKGTRPLTDKVLSKLIPMMGLELDKRKYFELLVRKERLNEDNPLYQEYEELLELLRSKSAKIKTLDEAQLVCDFSWLHLIIREMALLKNARVDLPWIEKCLSKFGVFYSKKDILFCIEDLKQAQLLLERDGELYIQDPIVTFEDEKDSDNLPLLIRELHKSAINQSISGLKMKPNSREYGSMVVATTPENFRYVKKRLKTIFQELLDLLENPQETPTLVAAFSFQFYPVAQVIETDSRKNI